MRDGTNWITFLSKVFIRNFNFKSIVGNYLLSDRKWPLWPVTSNDQNVSWIDIYLDERSNIFRMLDAHWVSWNLLLIDIYMFWVMCSRSGFSCFISRTESTCQKWVFSLLLLIEILIHYRVPSWTWSSCQILIKWSDLSSWRHTKIHFRYFIGLFISTCKHLKLAWMEFEVQWEVVESRNWLMGKHHTVGTLFDFPLNILGNEFHLK